MRKMLTIIATVIVLAACGDGPTAATVDGVYLLRRVNGSTLPGIVETSATDTTRATGGTLTIANAGTWEAELVLEIRTGGLAIPSSMHTGGTYRRIAETIELKQTSDGTVVPATIRGSQLIISSNGVDFEFERK